MNIFSIRLLHTRLGKLLCFLVLLVIVSFGVRGCSSHTGDEEQLKENVDSFASSYYNWQFRKALKYCTPESEMWLRYAASNVHQADVDILRAQSEGASHKIQSISYEPGDTLAYVRLLVRNYLRMDTIGNAGRIISKATFKLPVVRRHKRWMVKMEDLPRSENRNHD